MKLDRFIKRPVLSTVISIFIVILGIIGLATLPIERYPDIAPPTVNVRAFYPGANAETVINSVLSPLEESINGVENMTHMTSSASNSGSGSVTIYFRQGTDPDMAQVNVQNRVTQATSSLPAEVTRSGVSVSKRQNSQLMMFSIVSPDDRYDPIFIQNYVDVNILPQIQRVKGVGDASVQGAKTYTMRIWLKPDLMAQFGLVPQDISSALSEQNIEAAPGELGERGQQAFQYTLTTSGRLKTSEEFGDIVLRASGNGEILRLKDVATVELGAVSYAVNGYTDGHNSVPVSINQAAGSNATQVIEEIEDLLKEVEKTLPAGLEVRMMMNSNDFLYASINNVLRTLLEAFLLVMIVVFIFLQDFRSTLIPAIAIPVSLIGTFFVLKLLGFSINLLVLSALVLAIAIVVDDAIVVVEAVHAKLDEGYTSVRKASINAMNEISGAIVSITLVMMSVFIPVSFISGTTGVFYRQFGLTMAVAILFSGINALTLSPALCALFLRAGHDKETGKKKNFKERFFIAFDTHYETLVGKYRKSLNRIANKRGLTFGAVGLTLVALVALMSVTPSGFIPNEDLGTIMVEVSMQPGTSQDETQKVVDRVAEIMQAQPEMKTVTRLQGFGLMGGMGSSFGTIFAQLDNWSNRSGKTHSLDAVLGRLRREFAQITNANVFAMSPPTVPGFGMSGGFSMSLQDRTGGDINEFYGVAMNYLSALNQRPEIAYAQTSFNPSFPMYEIELDVPKLKMAGISPSTIYSTLQGYIGGMYVSNFNSFGRLYRVYMQAEPDSRANPESLNRIYVRNGTTMAPITQFVNLTKVYGPMSINRFNLFNSIDVNGAPADGYSTGQAIQAIREVAAEVLPSEYTYEFSGLTREEQNTGTNTTVIIFVLCLVFIYLLLAAQYESYILPLAVIFSIPFGLLGSFVFAQLFGVDNNIYMQIALIMLIGLLAKNAILIIEFAKQRRESGLGILESATSAAQARLRPIVMTSLALIIGLLPLIFSSGAGARGNYALGVVAVGGMLIGVVFQIFLVPGLFVAFQHLQEKVAPVRNPIESGKWNAV